MAKPKSKSVDSPIYNYPPASTDEARENQLIALATNLAEKQMLEGTASAQVITHYLKLGSMKERMEREMMKEQIKLLTAKTEALKSAKHVEELYAEAMAAFRRYSGQDIFEEAEDQY